MHCIVNFIRPSTFNINYNANISNGHYAKQKTRHKKWTFIVITGLNLKKNPVSSRSNSFLQNCNTLLLIVCQHLFIIDRLHARAQRFSFCFFALLLFPPSHYLPFSYTDLFVYLNTRMRECVCILYISVNVSAFLIWFFSQCYDIFFQQSPLPFPSP
jgi:hypothetical protein